MTDKTNQKNITVNGGSNVGHDQINTTYQFNGHVSQMTSLNIAFIEEAKRNIEFNELLPELEHYMTNVDEDKVLGLELKLKTADRESILPEANRTKELVAKRLHKHATSKAAQQIHTYVLGMLLHRFRAHIVPLIESGAAKPEIDKAVFSDVIEPTMEKLEGNPLDMFWDDIWGMIYYLTGNCHINWDKKC